MCRRHSAWILPGMSRVIVMKITTATGQVIRSFVRSEAEAYAMMGTYEETKLVVEFEELDLRA
jgi:hypothetical protein